MIHRRAMAALGVVPAFGMMLAANALAQTAQWPAGRQQLAWLEGRWSDSDCRTSYAELRFTGPGQTGLTYNTGPAKDRMRVDVYYDIDGKVVLYFPSVSHRSIVTFKNKDAFDTLDIEKDGKTERSSYRRCSP
jgi:hypothetical protein